MFVHVVDVHQQSIPVTPGGMSGLHQLATSEAVIRDIIREEIVAAVVAPLRPMATGTTPSGE